MKSTYVLLGVVLMTVMGVAPSVHMNKGPLPKSVTVACRCPLFWGVHPDGRYDGLSTRA